MAEQNQLLEKPPLESPKTFFDKVNSIELVFNVLAWAIAGTLDMFFRNANTCGVRIQLWISVMLALIFV
jgi:hypothetical protein